MRNRLKSDTLKILILIVTTTMLCGLLYPYHEEPTIELETRPTLITTNRYAEFTFSGRGTYTYILDSCPIPSKKLPTSHKAIFMEVTPGLHTVTFSIQQEDKDGNIKEKSISPTWYVLDL